jgi:hypothetical protein
LPRSVVGAGLGISLVDTTDIAQGRRHRAEGRRQKLRKSRVSTIKNVLITLAVAITLIQNLPFPAFTLHGLNYMS